MLFLCEDENTILCIAQRLYAHIALTKVYSNEYFDVNTLRSKRSILQPHQGANMTYMEDLSCGTLDRKPLFHKDNKEQLNIIYFLNRKYSKIIFLVNGYLK